jgi:hypothetical protein
MKIHINSNFFVPGLGQQESVTLPTERMTLYAFLEELARISPTTIEYVRPGADTLDPDDWEVAINDTPYQHCPGGLFTTLSDGDRITIKIMAYGGG